MPRISAKVREVLFQQRLEDIEKLKKYFRVYDAIHRVTGDAKVGKLAFPKVGCTVMYTSRNSTHSYVKLVIPLTCTGRLRNPETGEYENVETIGIYNIGGLVSSILGVKYNYGGCYGAYGHGSVAHCLVEQLSYEMYGDRHVLQGSIC